MLLKAPTRAVTINGGEECNSWYDIKSMGGDFIKRAVFDDVVNSAELIQDIIN